MIGEADSNRVPETGARNAQTTRDRRQRCLESIAALESASASERLQKFLELGISEFGMGGALVTEIVDDEAHFISAVSVDTVIKAGDRCPAEITFCRQVLVSEDPVGVPDVESSWLRDHPARKTFGVESYLACRVSGSPENQTTLCFIDFAPHEEPFALEDLEFMRRLAYRANVELKNAARETELAMMRALFDNFMNNSPVVATLKDGDGAYRYVNRIADPGISSWLRQFEGRVDRDILDPSEYGPIRESDLRVLNTGETVQSTHRIKVSQDDVRHWHIIKFPVQLPGEEVAVGTVAVDITARVEAETQLAQAYQATLEGWSRSLEIRDRETQGHSRRVADMTVSLARRLGMPEPQIVHLWRGALLHDLGKIGIPDSILYKEGSLTDAEWEVMRRHPEIAIEMLSPIPFLRPALDIPASHHERWDGKGYPKGLRGDEIPWSARIFAAIDVFDALTSDRPYRKALSRESAIEYICSVSRTHLDPRVVKGFLSMIREEE